MKFICYFYSLLKINIKQEKTLENLKQLLVVNIVQN